MKTRTKIICTIGPAVDSIDSMVELINNGMDVARVNFSHGSVEGHLETIKKLIEARERCQKPLAIMIDTKGPEIRLGRVPEKGIPVKAGTRLRLTGNIEKESPEIISIRPSMVTEFLTPGMPILIDNGYMQAKVIEKHEDEVVIEFENTGIIYSSKGVNIPSIKLPLPALTPKDIEDIRLACLEGADIIAASFIRNPDNILEIRQLLNSLSKPNVLVLAKIESMEGVVNFDSILQVSDGIMVARGDLGVEVPLSQVPRFQKMMIRKCNFAGKPVVTATQMLESMMNNPRPTRAEVSDVANAIYDGTSAVMLSGETAVGNYPTLTVQIMRSIIAEAERDFNYREFFEAHMNTTYHDVPSAVTLAGVKTAYSLGAEALFVPTFSGMTARLVSRLKPSMPIIALTPNRSVFHQLALSWGVVPILTKEICGSMEDAFSYLSRECLEKEYLVYGDLVVLISGWPFWVSGSSNTIRVDSLGHVLTRGTEGIGKIAHGSVTFAPVASLITTTKLEDKILILTQYDSEFFALVCAAGGIILQSSPENKQSETALKSICEQYGKPLILGVDDVFRTFKEDQIITIDPTKAIVYKGLLQ